MTVDAGKYSDIQSCDGSKGVAEDGDELCAIVVVELWIRCRGGHAESICNTLGNIIADTIKLDEDIRFDDLGLQMGSLEADGVDEELLLDRNEGVVEKSGLRPDIGECG